jgi:hypothetical protein
MERSMLAGGEIMEDKKSINSLASSAHFSPPCSQEAAGRFLKTRRAKDIKSTRHKEH